MEERRRRGGTGCAEAGDIRNAVKETADARGRGGNAAAAGAPVARSRRKGRISPRLACAQIDPVEALFASFWEHQGPVGAFAFALRLDKAFAQGQIVPNAVVPAPRVFAFVPWVLFHNEAIDLI